MAHKVIDVAGLYVGSVTMTRFIAETFEFNRRARKKFNRVLKPKKVFEDLKDKFQVVVEDLGQSVMFRINSHTYLHADISEHAATFLLASEDDTKFEGIFSSIEAILPPKETGSTVSFVFWSGEGTYANSYRKSLSVPSWSEICENYSAPVREALEKLMKHKHSEISPRIIVLHGDSGTGKTYAIRSLAESWSEWCSIEYITDAENLFSSSSYLMHMLEEDDEAQPNSQNKPARLFIVEDCGALLSPEASTAMEQALSNVLNLTSGLLGQSYGTYLLFTTNNKVRERHPAIMRQGRILADIEFSHLSTKEVADWCERHGVTQVPKKDETLANLFALIDDERIETKIPVKTMGFR